MLTMENKQYRFYTHDPKLPTITINLILSNENEGELCHIPSRYSYDVDGSCIIITVYSFFFFLLSWLLLH